MHVIVLIIPSLKNYAECLPEYPRPESAGHTQSSTPPKLTPVKAAPPRGTEWPTDNPLSMNREIVGSQAAPTTTNFFLPDAETETNSRATALQSLQRTESLGICNTS